MVVNWNKNTNPLVLKLRGVQIKEVKNSSIYVVKLLNMKVNCEIRSIAQVKKIV